MSRSISDVSLGLFSNWEHSAACQRPRIPARIGVESRADPGREVRRKLEAVRRIAMHRVLITGAGGGIGRSLRETLRGVYPVLRLSDRVALAPARDGEEVDQTEIADMTAVERMVEG